MFLSRWNTLAKATTTIESSPGRTDSQQDGDDQSEHEENAKCSRERTNHVSSQSRIHTSNAAMSLKSGSTSANPSQSPYSSFDLKIAQAKHELIVTLMKEVYALFDTIWRIKVRTCAPSQQESSGTQSQPSKLKTPWVGGTNQRRKKDRDSSPPGDGMTIEGRWTVLMPNCSTRVGHSPVLSASMTPTNIPSTAIPEPRIDHAWDVALGPFHTSSKWLAPVIIPFAVMSLKSPLKGNTSEEYTAHQFSAIDAGK